MKEIKITILYGDNDITLPVFIVYVLTLLPAAYLGLKYMIKDIGGLIAWLM